MPRERLLPEDGWRGRLFRTIYFADTKSGKLFDVTLLIVIAISCVVVMLDSVPAEHAKYGDVLYVLEWIFTILFSIEYILRLVSIKNNAAYVLSPMGIIDLLAILPTYLSLFVVGTQFLIVIRLFRLLRIFRIFKLWNFMDDGNYILRAIAHSYRKIAIFLLFIIIIVIIVGSGMYLLEGGKNGFTSIPASIYWAVVTITTVGYGDISPVTGAGKLLSIILMLCGYSIIAVPTGIVTNQFIRHTRKRMKQVCKRCGEVDNDYDARYCKTCGEKLIS